MNICKCIENCVHISGPSAPAASATVVSSTAINVTWTEPDSLNGVLQSYTVTGIPVVKYIHAIPQIEEMCILQIMNKQDVHIFNRNMAIFYPQLCHQLRSPLLSQ